MSGDALEKVQLSDVFIVPPFSVLDTRQGYWRKRKREWRDAGITSTEGRGENLTFAKSLDKYGGGTSEFDPVLCEVSYLWFCPSGGSVLDPFCGGSVRGIVAQATGHAYTGFDIRQEQVDANNANAERMGVEGVRWVCDDASNLLQHVERESADMVFSCPPYADLEVYSEDPRDLSNMGYSDFIAAYRRIIAAACEALKQDRFAVFVVGDVRDKRGAYRRFVDDTKQAFEDAGLMFYNDMVLVEPVASAAIRAAKQMNASRKVVKTHQNVLVFYKGDTKAIKGHFPMIEQQAEWDDFNGETETY